MTQEAKLMAMLSHKYVVKLIGGSCNKEDSDTRQECTWQAPDHS